MKKIIELEEEVNIGKLDYDEIALPARRYCELVEKQENEIINAISKIDG